MTYTAQNAPTPRAGISDRLDARPQLPGALFTYGSLMFPEVLRALLGRVPASVAATAEGWRAVAIPDATYPALVAGPGNASGRLLLDLRAEEWQIIDAYENAIYELCPISVAPAAAQDAVAYVCRTGENLTDIDWDRDRFAEEDLAQYVLHCASWREQAFG